LYSNPSNHLQIRTLGVQYLQEHPERFIESNVEQSWLRYLNNMSKQGIWADHIIIQAVAEALHLRINVVETAHNFAESTIVEGTSSQTHPSIDVYIGHLGESHYVSTRRIVYVGNRSCDNNNDNNKNIPDPKEKRRLYMKEYMRKQHSNQSFVNKEKKLFRQRKFENDEKIKSFHRKSVKKYADKNKEKIRKINNQAFSKRKLNQTEHVKEINKQAFSKKKLNQTEHVREINKQAFSKKKLNQTYHVREIEEAF